MTDTKQALKVIMQIPCGQTRDRLELYYRLIYNSL